MIKSAITGDWPNQFTNSKSASTEVEGDQSPGGYQCSKVLCFADRHNICPESELSQLTEMYSLYLENIFKALPVTRWKQKH